MPQRVEEIMTRDPRTVDSGDPARCRAGRARRRHRRRDRDGRRPGQRDPHRPRHRDPRGRGGRDPESTSVADVASSGIEALTPDQSVDEAVKAMREKDIRRLPVCKHSRPVGILSLGDLAIEREPRGAGRHLPRPPRPVSARAFRRVERSRVSPPRRSRRGGRPRAWIPAILAGAGTRRGSPSSPPPGTPTASSGASSPRSRAASGSRPRNRVLEMVEASVLYSTRPVIDCANQVAIQNGHHDHQRVLVEPPAQAAHLRPAWRVWRARARRPSAPVGLDSRLVQLLRLRRAPLQQPHREQDEESELEVLGLPVLHHGHPGRLRRDSALRDARVAVPVLILVEVRVAGERLQGERDEEQREERERETVVLDEGAHERLSSGAAPAS